MRRAKSVAGVALAVGLASGQQSARADTPPVSNPAVGSSTVVTVDTPQQPPADVATTTGAVASTSTDTPAAGTAQPLPAAGPQAGAASGTTAPTITTTTDSASNGTDSDQAATVTSDDEQIQVDDLAWQSRTSSTEDTAQTENHVRFGRTTVNVSNGVQLVVRDGKSRTRVVRRRRAQTAVGEADIGDPSSSRAAAADPAVSLAGRRVTVALIRAKSVSRAAGRQVSTRLRLDVRDLVVRGRDGRRLFTIRHAQLTRDGDVRMRVRVTAPGRAPIERIVRVRANANVLDRRTYSDVAVRAAVGGVLRELRPDLRRGRALYGLEIRIGHHRIRRIGSGRRVRSSGQLDALVIRLREPETASALGFHTFTATFGQVASLSRAVARGVSRIPVAAATGIGAVSHGLVSVAGHTQAFFFRPPKLALDRKDIKLVRRTVQLRLTCTSDVSGTLALAPARPGSEALATLATTTRTRFSCSGGHADLEIDLTTTQVRALRGAKPELRLVVSGLSSAAKLRLPDSVRL